MTMSRFLLAGVCAFALLTTSAAAPAEDTSQGAAVAAEPSAEAPGCPYSEGGKCCATCQERAARAAAGEEPQAPMGECPCQRAKRLREKAAQTAGEQQID
jgi:hypothetical protein